MISHFSCVCLFVTQWTVACKAPLSMDIPRQEYWSRLPCPPPGDFPYPRVEPHLTFPALTSGFFTSRDTWEAPETRVTSITYKVVGVIKFSTLSGQVKRGQKKNKVETCIWNPKLLPYLNVQTLGVSRVSFCKILKK